MNGETDPKGARRELRKLQANQALCRCGHMKGDHSRNELECLHDECDCHIYRRRPHDGAAPPGRKRTYSEPFVGEIHIASFPATGNWTIVELLRGAQGRADLRIVANCTCGAHVESFEYNFRKMIRSHNCTRPRRARAAV